MRAPTPPLFRNPKGIRPPVFCGKVGGLTAGLGSLQRIVTLRGLRKTEDVGFQRRLSLASTRPFGRIDPCRRRRNIVMFRMAVLSILVSVTSLPAAAHCTGLNLYTTDSPDFFVTERVLNRSIVSEVDIRQHGVAWATDFKEESPGIYISYKLDANSAVYLLLTCNKITLVTPHLKKGLHQVTLELWSYITNYFNAALIAFQCRSEAQLNSRSPQTRK
jgi:hypothetical protein